MSSNPGVTDDSRETETLLRIIIRFSWILVILAAGGSWYIINASFGHSVLVGGILANMSFLLLRRDIRQMLDRVAQAGEDIKSTIRLERVRFFLKFYARLLVLGLLLYAVATTVELNMIGVALGLSTVVFSVIVVALGMGRTISSNQRLKGV